MESIRLDLVPDGAMPELHASQYDKGRRFRLNLLDFGIDYTLDGTETLTIEERKVDGNICVRVVANTFSGKKYVEFTTTEQMCACAGYNLCELHIVKGEDSIGTLNFVLVVERSPIEGGLSESEIENLYTQIDARVDVDVADIMDDYYKKSETYSSEEIDDALDLKANASDVYDKTEIDTALALKANTSDVNTALALKADKATTYNKTEVDNLVAPKADKSYVDSELATKADQANTYNKAEVDALINALPTPMVFKGTLGTGGTITTLPSASASNEGYTYKVITAGTYQGIVCKVGDVVTSNGSEWVLIPSGDTDSDTWRAIKINGTEKLGNAISTGAVDFEQGDNITITFDADGNKIIVATTGIYTKAEVDALIAGKCDYPTETASGTIASFNTDLASALKECEVSFTAYQASGTPTPSAPIPISGFSSATVTREKPDHTNSTSVVIPFGDTYYGGVLDVVRGKLRALVGIEKFNNLNWTYQSTGTRFYTPDLASVIKHTEGYTDTIYLVCEVFLNAILNDVFDNTKNNLIGVAPSGNIFFRCNEYNDVNALMAVIGNNYIVYELATPIEIDLTPVQIATLVGDNNVFCDIPTSSVEVAFKVSIEKYINDLLNP